MMLKKYFYLVILFILFLFQPIPVYAMHISEGFLPIGWSIFWSLISLPFIIIGLRSIKQFVNTNPRFKMLLVFAGAFTFVLSALKIPSISGSCSHPTGVGLGAILFGATSMTVVSSIVLLFQALLLAHGGITTLGANIFSMGIVGPISACFIYKLFIKLKAPQWFCVFLAASLGDLMTYVTTSFQLAMAYPDQIGGFEVSLIKFLSVFAITQIPLAISEGIITVVIFNILSVNSHRELEELKILPGDIIHENA